MPTRTAELTSAAPAAPCRDEATHAALAAVRRLVRALRLSARRVESTTGLSAAQLFVLRQIAATPGVSLTELGAQTLSDRTTVRFLVDRLAAAGLVERGRSEQDRRRATVRLSAAGEALLRDAPLAPTTELLAGFARLPDGDLRTLATALTRLTDGMGLGREPAGMLFADGIADGAEDGGGGAQDGPAADRLWPRGAGRAAGVAEGGARGAARGRAGRGERSRAPAGGRAASRPEEPPGSPSLTFVHTIARRDP